MANEIVRIAGQNFYSAELYHHGVLGMKWGKHIFGGKSGGAKKPAKPKKESLDDKIKKMSDEEVQKTANRLANEVRLKENYKKLHPKQVSKGRQFANDIGKQLYQATMDATKQAATDFAKKQISKALNSVANDAEEKKS